MATRSLVFFNGEPATPPILIAERRTGVVSFHEDPPRATQALLKNLRPPWLIGG